MRDPARSARFVTPSPPRPRKPSQCRETRARWNNTTKRPIEQLPYHPEGLHKGTVYDVELLTPLALGRFAPFLPAAPEGRASRRSRERREPAKGKRRKELDVVDGSLMQKLRMVWQLLDGHLLEPRHLARVSQQCEGFLGLGGDGVTNLADRAGSLIFFWRRGLAWHREQRVAAAAPCLL